MNDIELDQLEIIKELMNNSSKMDYPVIVLELLPYFNVN